MTLRGVIVVLRIESVKLLRHLRIGYRTQTYAYMFAAVLLAPSASSGEAPASVANRDAVVTSAPGDPWERLNRKNYAIQGVLDRRVIRPLSWIYRKLTPGPLRRGIHNVIVNLSEPVVIVNDVLQLRFKQAGVSATRLVTNSTIGLLGLLDAAGHAGLPHHDNGFGVTMGRYGVSSGPYLYVPMVGPSTVRDLTGEIVDFVSNPMHWATYAYRARIDTGQLAVGGLDTRVLTEDQLNALLSGAVDPYATLRSVYLQDKKAQIDGEGVPQDLPSFDESPVSPTPVPSVPLPDK